MQSDTLPNPHPEQANDEIVNNSIPIEDPTDRFLRMKGKVDTAESEQRNIEPNPHASDTSKEEIVEKSPTLQEINSLKERLQENQGYARSMKRSMSFLNKSIEESIGKINELVENGDLSEEQSRTVLDILKAKNPNHNIKEPKSLSEKIENDEDSNPFAKFYNIANRDVLEEYILQAADDDIHEEEIRNQVANQIKAYDFFMAEATEEELKHIYQDFSKVEDKPIRLFKKMLSVGKQFMNEGYSDFNKAGGIRKYLKEKNGEIEVLQKKIDKLDKEMSKYKMYDKPTFNIKESSDSKGQEIQYLDPADKVFYARRHRG